MSKIISCLVIAIFVAVGAIYFTLGPNIFLGGPSKNDIISVTRSVMMQSAPDEALKIVAQNAGLTPNGLCAAQGDGRFICSINITTPNGTQSFTSILKKDQSENWVAAE